MGRTREATGPARYTSASNKEMEERRAHGFRVRPSHSQVLGYIAEGEPLPINLPNRNASMLTSSHFWLDDYPQSSEPEPAQLPHTTVLEAIRENADDANVESETK